MHTYYSNLMHIFFSYRHKVAVLCCLASHMNVNMYILWIHWSWFRPINITSGSLPLGTTSEVCPVDLWWFCVPARIRGCTCVYIMIGGWDYIISIWYPFDSMWIWYRICVCRSHTLMGCIFCIPCFVMITGIWSGGESGLLHALCTGGFE